MIQTDIFSVLLTMAIALISARILGYIFYKGKQPAVIGEIIAGIILGGIGIYLLNGQQIFLFDFKITIPAINFQSQEFDLIAEIGILFLLFISGLEISLSRLKKMGKTSTYVAIGGAITPFFLGLIAIVLLSLTSSFDFSIREAVVVGLILTATSVGVTARTLMDMGALDTNIGATILGSAVIDDVIGIILLAFAIGIGSLLDALWIGIRIAIFFFVFLYIGLRVIDRILELGEKIHLPKAFVSISLSILLIYAYFADKAGISGIIGAFIAGVLIGQSVRSKKISDDVKTIGYGLFVPLFFVWVGSRIWNTTGDFWQILPLIIILASVIILISIIGKIVGCGIGAKLGHMTNMESLQIGIGMIPRMELALIIATVAIRNNILLGKNENIILISTVLLTIVTTIITPLLIKASFKK